MDKILLQVVDGDDVVAVGLKIQRTANLLNTLQLKQVLMHADYGRTDGENDFIKFETNRKFIGKPSCVL